MEGKEEKHLKSWVLALSSYVNLCSLQIWLTLFMEIWRKLWSEAETLSIFMPTHCSTDFRHADRQERIVRGTKRLWAHCARPWTKSSTYSLPDPHSNPWGDIISILLTRQMRLREKCLVQGQAGLGLGDRFQECDWSHCSYTLCVSLLPRCILKNSQQGLPYHCPA